MKTSADREDRRARDHDGSHSDASRSPKHQRLATEAPSHAPASDSRPQARGGEKRGGPSVDREKTCPMFVRMFCRMHGHHHIEDFERDRMPTEDELILYTWRDASLKELTNLIKEVHEESRRRDAKFSFRLVYQDSLRGRMMTKELGYVYNRRSTRDDDRTLDDARFIQGDYIDVAIYLEPPAIAPPEHVSYRVGEMGSKIGYERRQPPSYNNRRH